MANPKNAGARRKFTVEQVCHALDETRGMITMAADILRCAPNTLHRYINEFEEIKTVLESHRERRIDKAEFALDEKVEEGDLGAIKYVLSTIGKSRGYGEQTDHRHLHEFGSVEVPAMASPDEWQQIAEQHTDYADDSSDRTED